MVQTPYDQSREQGIVPHPQRRHHKDLALAVPAEGGQCARALGHVRANVNGRAHDLPRPAWLGGAAGRRGAVRIKSTMGMPRRVRVSSPSRRDPPSGARAAGSPVRRDDRRERGADVLGRDAERDAAAPCASERRSKLAAGARRRDQATASQSHGAGRVPGLMTSGMCQAWPLGHSRWSTSRPDDCGVGREGQRAFSRPRPCGPGAPLRNRRGRS